MAMLQLHYSEVVAAATVAASARREAVLQLPCHPGENKLVTAVPMAPGVLPASQLTPCYPGLNKLLEQQDNWCYDQNEKSEIHIITIDLGYLTNKMVPQCVLSHEICEIICDVSGCSSLRHCTDINALLM